MQVLKFGGTSVANADNINKVISIVHDAINKDKTIVVVSALGGVTDLLLDAALLAAEGKESYKEKLGVALDRHVACVQQLINGTGRDQMLALVQRSFEEIEGLCSGLFLLGELTARSKDRISHYGILRRIKCMK